MKTDHVLAGFESLTITQLLMKTVHGYIKISESENEITINNHIINKTAHRTKVSLYDTHYIQTSFNKRET